MSGKPLVSVVIPVRDGERYLAEAIDSVLEQAIDALEVLVVDDGSSDGSCEIAESYAPRVRLHAQESSGAGAARNLGVALTSGRYVAFLDADDLWTPHKLAFQLGCFAARPELDMVFGRLREFASPDLAPTAPVRPRPGLQPAYLPGGLLVRREAFLRVGPFREDLAVGEFVDWMARAREHGLLEASPPHAVLLRRVHGANTTVARRDRMTDLARVVKESLDRRRAAAEEAAQA